MMRSMKALCFDRFGGPEVLSIQERPQPELGPGDLLVRTRAIGLNFADVYRRKGNYHLQGTPPYVLGYEGAGEVVAIGDQATSWVEGARVGFADVPFANAELVRVPQDHAIPLPEDVSFDDAAAVLLQGFTAHYLVHDSRAVRAGESALVHSAGGGVGAL